MLSRVADTSATGRGLAVQFAPIAIACQTRPPPQWRDDGHTVADVHRRVGVLLELDAAVEGVPEHPEGVRLPDQHGAHIDLPEHVAGAAVRDVAARDQPTRL